MKQKPKNCPIEETPHDMMMRVFAVADLIVRSDGYRQIAMKRSGNSQKHKSEDLVYRIDQHKRLGSTDGTEET